MAEADKIIDLLIHMAGLIGGMFEEKCEVVVHDLSTIDHSIVYIVNGHVTGRQVGDTLTDKALKQLREKPGQDTLIGYKSTTKEGKIIKSSSSIFRDGTGEPVAAICINYDTSDLIYAGKILRDFISITEIEEEINDAEYFTTNVNDLLEHLLDETITIVGKPVSVMNREDKLKAIKHLDEKGVFFVKKSVDQVANVLNVSKFTVYNYLDEVRAWK